MPYFNESQLEMSIVTLLQDNDNMINNQITKTK